ncbi:MAG: RodZ domain-containing protein [Acidobacteriota bacterium]
MAEEPEIDFGTFLRQARERRGISLQQVAATTKISARVLGALEHNDPSKLPGGIFARAFVRSYAREVGLDPEATVARFITDFPEAAAGDEGPVPATPEDPESFESSRRAVITILQLIGISILVVIAIVVYLSMRPTESPPAATPGSPPGGTSSIGTPSPPAAAVRSQDGGLPGVPGGGLAPPPEGSGRTETSGREPDAAALQPAGETAPPAPISLSIVSTEQCWVSLVVDGVEVVSRLLEPGERVSYDAQKSVTLKAGNAGALQLTLNGRRGRPFGTAGQVVTRTITPETIAGFIEQP